MRKNIDAAEYKHIVPGLIFLRYVSVALDELYEKLQKGEGDYTDAERCHDCVPSCISAMKAAWAEVIRGMAAKPKASGVVALHKPEMLAEWFDPPHWITQNRSSILG